MMSEELYLICQNLLKNRLNFKRSFSQYYYQKFMILTKGNPGSIRVLLELANNYSNFEHNYIEILELLKDYNITKERLWIFYKDICYKELRRFNYFLDLIKYQQIDINTLNYILIDSPETLKYRNLILAEIWSDYNDN